MKIKFGEIATGQSAEFFNRTNAVFMAIRIASPDRKRCSPVAVSRKRPVDVSFKPLAESTVLDEFGMPLNALVFSHEEIAIL